MNLGTELDGVADQCMANIRDTLQAWLGDLVEIPEQIEDGISAALYMALEEAEKIGGERGQEKGHEEGKAEGYRDAVEEFAYEVNAYAMDDGWNHRAREAGLEARAVNLPSALLENAVRLPVDDVTLTMPEHEAYRVLAAMVGRS